MKYKLLIFTVAAIAVIGPARFVGATTPDTTLPLCPYVTYDGDVNGPGPQWEGGTPPNYDCQGSAPAPAEVGTATSIVSDGVDYTPDLVLNVPAPVAVTPAFTG